MSALIKDNELLTKQVLEYLKATYGRQINGKEFTTEQILRWASIGKFPDIYGGNKIVHSRKVAIIGMVALTIENLDHELCTFAIKHFTTPLYTHKTTKKKRTKLYYQLAKKNPPSQASVLPDNYKELGIKRNQFK